MLVILVFCSKKTLGYHTRLHPEDVHAYRPEARGPRTYTDLGLAIISTLSEVPMKG